MSGRLPVVRLAIPLVFLPSAWALAQTTQGREYQDANRKDTPAAILKELQPGSTHQHVMMPMRDGVKLATDIFLPPGDGPWPVVLMRTPYGRLNTNSYAARLKKGNYAFVVQDLRGDGESEGKSTLDPKLSDNEIADGYDCVEWIAGQKWCNGRVGMFGGSGHGMAACMAYLSKAPHLTVVAPGNSAGNTYLYWSYENGLRRWLYSWLQSRGADVKTWPRPTLTTYDLDRWQKAVQHAAQGNPTIYLNSDGWFNIFLDSTVETFQAFGPTGKVFMSIGPNAHGSDVGVKFPSRSRGPNPEPVPGFLEILDGKPVPAHSRLDYFLMGDFQDPQAPGNEWRSTQVWPVPHTPVKYYLRRDHTLTLEAPGEKDATLTYAYDPKNPAPSLGGHYSYGKTDASGPRDQRPLTDRRDVLCFLGSPLAEPLTITGQIRVELFFSTDVPDTSMVVKLLDVYPSGYQALIREGAMMARYHDGPSKPSPLEKGKVYKLDFSIGTTALVFNRGHRLGILVTSSSDPAYEVHPNTYEPVKSIDESVAASNTIHLSATNPSCVILPVVKEEKTTK